MATAGGKPEMVRDDSVRIPCLSTLPELQRLCEKSGLKLSGETSDYLLYQLLRKIGPSHAQKLVNKLVEKGQLHWDTDFEVETILDRKLNAQSKECFLIKWKGWSPYFNTWEPRENLQRCEYLIDQFLRQAKKSGGGGGAASAAKRKAQTSLEGGGSAAAKKERIDELFCRLRRTHSLWLTTSGSLLDLSSPAAGAAATAAGGGGTAVPPPPAVPLLKGLVTSEQIKSLLLKVGGRQQQQRQLLLPPRRPCSSGGVQLRRKREAVQEALKKWEHDINAVSTDPVPIVVMNDFDLEGPPDNFTFVNDYIPREGVTIPNDPIIGCECTNCLDSRASCCGPSCGSVFAYSSAGRVRVPPGTPIYECNKRCCCPHTCANRVVQNGRKVKVAIFRTHNGCGWGVKALQKIKKGTFIMEYIGEIITNEEAERRGRVYDAEGRTYLFDLDYNDGDCPFTVDAGFHGNISHFVNHSCDPNMSVYGVWIDTLDPRLPRICMFAKRDIAREEELTFDYMMTGDTTVQKRDDNSVVASSTSQLPASASADAAVHANPPAKRLSASSPRRSSASSAAAAASGIDGCSSAASGKPDVIKEGSANPQPPQGQAAPAAAGALRFSCLQYRIVCQCRAQNCRKYLF